jgi:hypothetical protein
MDSLDIGVFLDELPIYNCSSNGQFNATDWKPTKQSHLKHIFLQGWYKLRDERIAKILD